jgi:hypothetical protein
LVDNDRTVLLPVVLLLFATLAAAVMAYGTHPAWAQFEHGFQFILISRRLQWPMVTLSLVLCLVLLGLVIAGRKRAWWLIGLGPILALFVHRFPSDRVNPLHVIENPTFAAAADAKFVADDDWVVALRFADQDYAYPYAALYETPVVIHAEHDKRLAVLWSAYANRVIAVEVGRDLRGPDLEVVSTPANALLVYNKRLGQFINGVTARTPDGAKPDGFRDAVPSVKTTWKAWRTRHPETKVLTPAGRSPAAQSAPRGPILPTYPLRPSASDVPTGVRVTLVEAKVPIALSAEHITAKPVNTGSDGPVLVFRDPADGGVRAFQRQVEDLRPRFRANTDPKRKGVAYIDADTGAGWNTAGEVVDGPREMRGKRLLQIPADDHLDWRVLKCWYPNLEITPAS